MHSSKYRWLIGSLVLVAIVAILLLKFRGAATTSNLPVAEMASATAALTPTPPPPDEEADPFPSKADPATQIEWVLRHKKPAMILFHSNLCRPCLMMEALVQMVRRDYEPTVVFIEVVIDDPANADLVRAARVGSIPASFFVDRSGQAKRVVGLMKQQDLRAEL
ncbi:MAG: thioredoxin family protein, partial [Chloroflexi bacterium]|nr:thioredoxin family protein [Chloroflexota bacterium]